MKKLFAYILVPAVLVMSVWISNAAAAPAQQCEDAVFQCKNKAGSILGTVSFTCSLQVPYNELMPRCMPNFPQGKIFPTMDACRDKYPTAFEACPTQPWPSGYAFSQCVRYPTF
jgi:hypothetical protein